MLIIESIAAYLAIIAPSAITIITALISLCIAITKFLTIVKQVKGLKDETLTALAQQSRDNEAIRKENAELKKNHAELMAAITRIRNKHPEEFCGKDGE